MYTKEEIDDLFWASVVGMRRRFEALQAEFDLVCARRAELVRGLRDRPPEAPPDQVAPPVICPECAQVGVRSPAALLGTEHRCSAGHRWTVKSGPFGEPPHVLVATKAGVMYADDRCPAGGTGEPPEPLESLKKDR